MKEQYFICGECGELSTLTEQIDDAEHGGSGLCGCLFIAWEWSDKHQSIEPWFPRRYPEWIHIKKKWYDRLKAETNHVTRLKIFNAIPKEKR